MNAEPLVSLIMPVWQPRRAWLHQAVSSALGQRECRLELIVIDDGCPTPVADLLADITDTRLRVIRIAHGGQAAARNAGIAEARGEWIRFADADDVLEPDSTRHLGSFMRGDRVVAYGATLVCDDELRPRRRLSSTLRGEVWAQCLLGQFDTRLPALLIPRRVVDAAGPWDAGFTVSADWDFVLRALEHALVDGDGHIAFHYRRHASSASRTASIALGEQARTRLIDSFLTRHPEQRGTRLERQARAALSLDRGRAYWKAGQRWAAATRLGAALRQDPQHTGAQLWGAAARRGARFWRQNTAGGSSEDPFL